MKTHNISKTMDQFKHLHEKVKEPLKKFGITKPTPIQRRAIPPVLKGKNSLLVAPTGTGKTEAALLPIFSQYVEKDTENGIKIIYIAPLRALNRDMLDRLQRWEEHLDLDIQVRHGDTTQYQRRQQALHPPDILITTPETMQAILPGSRMKEHLKSVRWVIVDEVHELAESKRGTQLSLGLERVFRLAGDFQRVGLSATVGDMEKMSRFLVGPEREVEIVNASSTEEMSIWVESPMPTESDAELSDDLNADPSTIARIRRIRDLIDEHESSLTFVNTREASEILGSRLKFWDSDFPVSVHHGSLSKDYRISSEDEFRKGGVKSIICTSSMELGIDIGNIDFVIQYMSPRQVKRLIQRVGRSGHKIREASEGVVIAADPDDVIEAGMIAERVVSDWLEPTDIHEKSLDVLAHQIVGFTLDGVSDPEKIFEFVSRAYPYRNFPSEEFFEVVEQLQDQGVLWRDDGEISRGKRSWKYYYTTLSMIPDIKNFQIEDMVTGQSIGTLDEEFVIDKAEPGVTFICQGEAWQVVEIEDDKVRVEPIDDPYGAIPAWEGELIPVDSKIAEKSGIFRKHVKNALADGEDKDGILEDLESRYPVEKDALEWSLNYLEDQDEEAYIPTDDGLLIETYKDFAVLHVPLGTNGNRTMGQILSALLTTRLGASVRIKTDPYRIAFRFPDKPDPELIETTLRDLEPDYIEPLLEKILKKSSVFRWRLLHVAKKFGAIEKDADYSKISGDRLVEAYQDTPLWTEAEREVRLEKLNVPVVKKLLESLENDEIEIETISRGYNQGPTPIGLPILNELAASGELVVPERAEREILKALKRRLKNEQIKLLCLNCLDWSTLTRVRRLDEKPECGNCGARLLGLTPKRGREVRKLLEKERREEKLDDEEKHRIKRFKDTANMIITHGKKAITAMAGRGIGPTTASRILRKQPETEDDFYREILDAERQYARTHGFWD
ncbi:hypothetical protein AKJ52_02315 [candidate division MSBL1 archaeon SCGC-AAA382C18]|uniref:Helicase n=1 Tax=candidate division MSBL1 archaeon SCGC-AAA382C18 TaxID=1698281 RepID=A0A133VIS1_9EURY|nr:hypothetical protein AKJ52_02315 [candidate division MSBL1 archaeon SCGC-AAA382C18]